jgi:hypothetical protein
MSYRDDCALGVPQGWERIDYDQRPQLEQAQRRTTSFPTFRTHSGQSSQQMPEFYQFNEAGNMKESAPTRCPNGHPLGPNTVLVGHGAPDLAVHRMRCMHDTAGVFPQPRVDSLAIQLSRQVDPGSRARSEGGTRAAPTAERSLLAGLRPLLVSSRVQAGC